MPVTLTHAPQELSFSADLLVAKFQCTGFIQQAGIKAVNKIPLSYLDAGETIEIKYGNRLVTLVITDTPDDSGNQFVPSTATTLLGEDLYADLFRQNYQLDTDFVISADSNHLYFTAREYGPAYNFYGSVEALNETPGVIQVLRPNYSVYFKLWLENEQHTGFDFIYQSNLILIPGTNGKAEAIIGDKLHVSLSKSIRANFPEQPDTSVIACKLSCRRYYFEFAESYGEPIAIRAFQRSSIYTVIHGGLSTFAQFKTSALALLAPSTAPNDKFLKQGSTTVLTRTNQPQYLYFVNTRNAKTVSIKTTIVFTDATMSVSTISGVQMEQYRKYAFNASLMALYTNPAPNKIVKEYKVVLMQGASQVSEERIYIIDYSTRKFIRYFLNWSSWGALDSRVTYGKGESEYELSNATAERVIRFGDDIRAGASVVFDSKLVRSYKVATGWLDHRELQLYADFYLSNLKYRYSQENMFPIAVSGGKISEKMDGENLLAQTFEYKYLIEDHAYTEGDAEDIGMSIAGYHVSFYPQLGMGGSGSGSGNETDPTVPAWVKNITQSDIDKWNASVSSSPSVAGNWQNVANVSASVTQNMPFQYKTDFADDSSKVITYVVGQLYLNTSFTGTSLLIGLLPAGNRPSVKIIEYIIVDNIELFLIIDTNGEISLLSKDGFNLPTGVANEKLYFINLNFKPAVALSSVAGKWVIDASGTSCEAGNTGYQINTQLKRVSDNVNEYPLDANNQYVSASGLPQATQANPSTAANYKVYNPAACPIPAGKWIVNTANWYCEAGNTGYKIFPQLVRVSDNAAQSPYDVNDNYTSVSGLPQATAVNPSSAPSYKEYNTSACPLTSGPPEPTGDIVFSLQQFNRKLRLSGVVSMTCTLNVGINYQIIIRDENLNVLNTIDSQYTQLTLNAGSTSVVSLNDIAPGSWDIIAIQSFTFTPATCGTLEVFINGQAGDASGAI